MKMVNMTLALSVAIGSMLATYPSVNLGAEAGDSPDIIAMESTTYIPLRLDQSSDQAILARHHQRLRLVHRCLELRVLRLSHLTGRRCAIAHLSRPAPVKASARAGRPTDPRAAPALALSQTLTAGG